MLRSDPVETAQDQGRAANPHAPAMLAGISLMPAGGNSFTLKICMEWNRNERNVKEQNNKSENCNNAKSRTIENASIWKGLDRSAWHATTHRTPDRWYARGRSSIGCRSVRGFRPRASQTAHTQTPSSAQVERLLLAAREALDHLVKVDDEVGPSNALGAHLPIVHDALRRMICDLTKSRGALLRNF